MREKLDGRGFGGVVAVNFDLDPLVKAAQIEDVSNQVQVNRRTAQLLDNEP